MALNQIALQTLDSPRLRPLRYNSLKGLSAAQLRMQLAAERSELAQLQNEIGKAMTALNRVQGERESNSAPPSTRSYSERQQLVREIQSVRNQKIAAAGQLQQLRNQLKQSDVNRAIRDGKKLYKKIEKENKRKAKEREKQRKKEETKDKLWNKKNIRKGYKSGEKAHARFSRFFESSKWSDKDKDEMRRLMGETAVYEGDEVFQLLSLMATNAFDSLEEAEDFLNDFTNVQKGRQTELQKLNDEQWDEEQIREGQEALQSGLAGIGGPGLHMTF